jgi:hypothetical protein
MSVAKKDGEQSRKNAPMRIDQGRDIACLSEVGHIKDQC